MAGAAHWRWFHRWLDLQHVTVAAGGGRDGRGDGGDGELPHRVEETQARGQVGVVSNSDPPSQNRFV